MKEPQGGLGDTRARVLYVAGTGRSGSTLLANILGEVDGFFNAGEVRYLWERGMLENRLCGCGRHFADCPLWQEILHEAFGSTPADPKRMAATQASLTRVRHLPALLTRGGKPSQAAADYLDTLARLYGAIARVTGCEVIVDASKLPSYGRLLGSVPGIQLSVVQLVRDPRAAAASWASIKQQPDRGAAGTMQRLSPLHSALLWNLWNAACKPFLNGSSNRYLRLRYEDFVAEPRATVKRIVELMGEGLAHLPFLDETTVELGPNHTVAGNPDRLRSGPTTIRNDPRPAVRIRGQDRMLVTALTFPLLVRFGYPLSRAAAPRAPRVGIQHLPWPLRTLRKVQRHWRWGRQEGFGRLVEEDQLDPRARLAGAARRREWRRLHPIAPGTTVPVLLVGLQRSGTNMVARALEANPEFEVRNESDSAAFDRFELRPLPVIRTLVTSARQRFLVLKPLIDSHRVDQLLADLGTPSPGKALWTYRGVDGRVRSALSKFGDINLQAVQAIARGRQDDVWQGRRLSPDSLELIRSLDVDSASPETAAALIWYIRNSLYFDLGLDRRDDCMLVSYDRLVDEPEREVRRICSFLGTDFMPAMIAGIGRRGGAARPELAIDPVVRRHCAELEQRLADACSSLQPT